MTKIAFIPVQYLELAGHIDPYATKVPTKTPRGLHVDNAGHLTRSCPSIVPYIYCRIFHVCVFSNDGPRDGSKAQFWSRKDFKSFAGWCINVKGKATAHQTRFSMWLCKEP